MALLTKGFGLIFALYFIYYTYPCCIQIEETIFICKSNASLAVLRNNVYCVEKHYISCASPEEIRYGLSLDAGGYPRLAVDGLYCISYTHTSLVHNITLSVDILQLTKPF